MKRIASRLFALCAMLSLVLLTIPMVHSINTVHAGKNDRAAKGQPDKSGNAESNISVVPSLFTSKQMRAIAAEAPTLDSGKGDRDAVQREVEPNDSLATAQPLTIPVRVRADSYKFPVPASGDVDVYSFSANAGDRVFANTMTSFSAGSGDTFLEVLNSAGAVLESDDEDGGFTGSSSNIAGLVLPTAGTYYVRVTPFTLTLAGTIRSYDLYVSVQSGAPTAEVEPNNNGQTPNPLPANGFISGVINPAADSDTFSLTAEAGDTIVAVMDVDPERDSPEWDGRLGIGLFDNNFLVVNSSAVGGTFDDANPSEAIMLTVNQTGTYVIYVDQPAGGGAATDTYNLSVKVIKPNIRKCTLYTGGTTGAITDAATTNFTLNIPDSRIISNMQVLNTITHSARADLDVSLVSPDGNEVVLYDDPSAAGTVTAPQIDFRLDDEAANIVSGFGINKPIQWTPEPSAKLDLFKGQQAQGTWTLRVRDDLSNASTGAVNAWGLNICEDPDLVGNASNNIFSTDFESGTAGFTHSGTLDEWERGTPSAAPITTCHSGTNCWKTDLDNTYDASSNQDLLSPAIDLTTQGGRYITAQWWQKYQMDTASNDTAYVEVREVGNPTNFRRLFEWKGALMTRTVGAPTAVVVNEAGGWGRMQYDISDFGGKMVELRFHLESGTGTTNFAGLTIDDVSVAALITPSRGDFNGNGPTDLSVFRPDDPAPGSATWYINANGSVTIQQFGASSDKPVPADYDGDGDVDIAVFRPLEGAWYISKGSNQNFDRVVWGLNGDIPVPGDYDGDGKADVAVFRPADGFWYILRSSDGGFTALPWGLSTDKPVQADFDGDGKTDVAVFRPSNGFWYIIQSFTNTFRFVQWGASTDTPVTGDYDGDRQFDVAVYRPSDGTWYILLSSTKALRAIQWGISGDIPVPSDFDGDRKYDTVVFRPADGTWHILRSSDGAYNSAQWGVAGDVPAPRGGTVPD